MTRISGKVMSEDQVEYMVYLGTRAGDEGKRGKKRRSSPNHIVTQIILH
jgi:hypothetical protein